MNTMSRLKRCSFSWGSVLMRRRKLQSPASLLQPCKGTMLPSRVHQPGEWTTVSGEVRKAQPASPGSLSQRLPDLCLGLILVLFVRLSFVDKTLERSWKQQLGCEKREGICKVYLPFVTHQNQHARCSRIFHAAFYSVAWLLPAAFYN